MFNDVSNHWNDATHYASIGLVIFFVVFLMILFNAFMRSRRDVSEWSRLPLADDAGPTASQEVRS